MILNFEFRLTCLLNSNVLTSGIKPFVTFEVVSSILDKYSDF